MHIPDEIKNSKILLVDDKLENLRLLISFFRTSGFTLFVAKNGYEALEILEEITPDLILLDIMMPGLSGFDVMKQLKGSPRWKEIPVVFLTAVSDSDSEIRGLEMGAVDYVTKPVKLESVLARVIAHLTIHHQKRKLIELGNTKDRFFSIIGHDLRSPISSIFSLASLLEEDFDSVSGEDLRRYVSMLKDSSKGVLNLLETLLNWARLERGAMPFRPEPLEVQELVNGNLALFQLQAEQKGIRIENKISSELSVYTDIQMFQTILRNLVSNALKFTWPGGVITVSASETEDGFIRFSVRDTGKGMGPGELEQLFRMEKTTRSFGTSGEKGAGLGLIVCRGMVERNGGTIYAESEPEKGSTFHFTLPLSSDGVPSTREPVESGF